MRARIFSAFCDGQLAAELRLGCPYYAQERDLRLPGRRLHTVRHLYVWPAYRGRGFANEVVGNACRWSDIYHWDLTLYVARIGRHGLTSEQLIALYVNHGFTVVPGPYRYPAMVRRWQERPASRTRSETAPASALATS